jgi:hypothetical protein
MEYIVIGGDAHSDVQAVERSTQAVGRISVENKVCGIFRGGDDGADPRFFGYEGLGLKPLAKVARERGFTGKKRYAEVIRMFARALHQERPEYYKYRKDVDAYAEQISDAWNSTGVPVKMFAGNADGFTDVLRLIGWQGRIGSEGPTKHFPGDTRFAKNIFERRNIPFSDYVALETSIAENVAVITIPYSFDVDVERDMYSAVCASVSEPSREVIEKSLEIFLGQLNALKPQVVVQIQHEPPVQSLVTMLDPRNRALEQAEVYQKAIDAITDMKPAAHLIFYGHVGNRHFAQAVPHELADRGIRTFHWPEEGGGMLYLNLNTLEVREEKGMINEMALKDSEKELFFGE